MKIKSLIFVGALCSPFYCSLDVEASDISIGKAIASLQNSYKDSESSIFISAKKLIETPGFKRIVNPVESDAKDEFLKEAIAKLNNLLKILAIDDESIFSLNSNTDIAPMLDAAKISIDDVSRIVDSCHDVDQSLASKIFSKIEKFSNKMSMYAKEPLSFGDRYVSGAIDLISSDKKFNNIQKAVLYEKLINETKPIIMSNYEIDSSLDISKTIANKLNSENKEFWSNLNLSHLGGNPSPYLNNWFIDQKLDECLNAESLDELNIMAEDHFREEMTMYFSSILKDRNPLQKELIASITGELEKKSKDYYISNKQEELHNLFYKDLGYLLKISDVDSPLYIAMRQAVDGLKSPEFVNQALESGDFSALKLECEKKLSILTLRMSVLKHVPLKDFEMVEKQNLESALKYLEDIK